MKCFITANPLEFRSVPVGFSARKVLLDFLLLLRVLTLARSLGIFEHPTVVYTGNFSSYQGLDLLIEAAAILRLKIPDVVFLLLGGTEFDIPPIAHLVAKHKLQRTLQLHHRVPRYEVADYLALADALVLPRQRGMNEPLKIFEYIKSQKPIVATDIPAHTALLNNQSVFLVKPEAKALAKGLLRVIQDTELAHNLAAEACRSDRSLKKKPLPDTLTEIYRFVMRNGSA